MDSSICVTTTTGLPALQQARTARCASGWRARPQRAYLHAQVAARHHHCVGKLDDGIQSLDGRGLLQLGQHTGAAIDDRAQLLHILRPLHEGQRHPVHTQAEAEVQILAVLGCERRNGQQRRRHIHALAFGEQAAGNDNGVGMAQVAGRHAQAQLAVIEQQFMPGLQHRKDLRVRQAHPRRIAGRFVQVQPEGRARHKRDRAGGKGADAQLWPLQIQQHRNGPPHLALDVPDQRQPLPLLGMGAVAEIEPEHVRARIEQGANGGPVRTGRTERGDDLSMPLASHRIPFH
jgi:hypothetical protein